MSARTRRRTKATITYVGLIVAMFVILAPYAWLILSSFKDRVDAFAIPPKLFFTPTLDNYIVAFQQKGFAQNLLNSAIVSTLSTALALIVGVPAAYSLARFRFRASSLFMMFLLAARMLPAIVLAVPLFILFNDVHLIDNYASLVLAYLTFNLPFAVWMMRGFFLGVPPEVDEAAVIDGCSYFGAFFRAVLPLTYGGLAATAIFCMINSWNEFLFALILTGRHTATLPVAIPQLLTPWGTFWGQIAAVGTVTTIPVLIFAFAVQRYLVRGMTGGAIQ
ncbi:MAG TPA: carbohydrate ABC transporter permease [Candidatus Limnocylindrales bacterium]